MLRDVSETTLNLLHNEMEIQYEMEIHMICFTQYVIYINNDMEIEYIINNDMYILIMICNLY
jgi:hypothetical protein